jgi:hypothetical protein
MSASSAIVPVAAMPIVLRWLADISEDERCRRGKGKNACQNGDDRCPSRSASPAIK